MKKITVVESRGKKFVFDSEAGVPKSLRKQPYQFLHETLVFEKGDTIREGNALFEVTKVFKTPFRSPHDQNILKATPAAPCYEVTKGSTKHYIRHSESVKPASPRERIQNGIQRVLAENVG